MTPVDFQVYEGLRTRARQAKLVASGASQTMDSRHLPGADGLGHAVDLVPLIDFDGDGNAELRWDWNLCYKVADAVRGMPEHARFLRGMFAWVGFKQVPLLYDRDKRFAGQTHYPFKKMLKLAADGIMSFSDKPLKLPLWLSFPSALTMTSPTDAPICPAFLTPTPASVPTMTILPAYIPPSWATSIANAGAGPLAAAGAIGAACVLPASTIFVPAVTFSV